MGTPSWRCNRFSSNLAVDHVEVKTKFLILTAGTVLCVPAGKPNGLFGLFVKKSKQATEVNNIVTAFIYANIESSKV